MSTEELGARVRRAKARGVPIVSVSTADPAQTIRVITDAINGDAPVVVWDVVRGVRPGNPAGTEAISQATSQMSPEETAGNCTAWFDWAATLPPKTLCFTLGADHWLDIEQPAGRSAVQALWNLRDSFKQNYRMMILLSPGMKMPTCLTNDVVPFDEPLPSREEMTTLIKSLDERASACQTCGGTGTMRGGRCGACSGKGKSKRKLADEDALRAAADAVVGLSAFAAEQIVSMALLKDGGMDQQMLWDSKRAQIRQVRGLTADNETWSFEDIGGHGQAKKFGSLLFSGPEPPTVVVRIEEIEKTMAGAQGDLSGTSQDALQVVLNAMEDYNWSGMIAFGPPGSGKSLYSKSLASTFNVLSLGLDLNATKGSLVGESEQTVRAAIKTIYAVGGKSVFCVATCNKLDSLPPELRRRFRYGTWMFDVPDAEERESIWRINRAKYDIAEDDPPPPDEGFTGADIRNLCELSRRTRMPLADAVQFVAPLCKSNPEAIERARQTATGKFLSSSRAGLYQPPRAAARREEEPRGARAMRME